MAFYLRKAIKVGPLRINLSKSGIGLSAGVTGARIGINSQGRTYVHGGRHGLYYRKNLGSSPRNNGGNGSNGLAGGYAVSPDTVRETFHSGNLSTLTDAQSEDFVNELQEKANRLELWRWLGFYPALAILGVILWSMLASATPVAASGYALLGATALLFAVWTFMLYKADLRRKTLELDYGFDDELTDLYYNFIEGFNKFSKTSKIWEILASVDTGGKGASIKRELVAEVSRHKLPTPYLITNIEIPYIRLKKIELFFLPERILLRRGNKYAAISYTQMTIRLEEKLFTESQGAPADAEVVEYTWLHARKNGEPDRRYKHNPQLPVCLYSTYHFESEAGLNELLMTSKHEAMHDFVRAIENLANALAGDKEGVNQDN